MQGMLDVVASGGLPKEIIDRTNPGAASPRRRGLMQGGLLFLSGFVIVPVLGVLTAMMNGEGYLVGLAAILTFLGGFIRMIYALIFQSGVPTTENLGFVETLKQDLTGKPAKQEALPPPQEEPIPASSYSPPSGGWKETNDLEPVSVTEETTRTLKNTKLHKID